jgi:hypothetical protein
MGLQLNSLHSQRCIHKAPQFAFDHQGAAPWSHIKDFGIGTSSLRGQYAAVP